MRRGRSDYDSEDEDIPLHHKKPFGAGLKRKRVEFVKATDVESGAIVDQSKSGAVISDMYASIVLGNTSKVDSSKTEFMNKDDAEATPGEEPRPPTCPICSLPITTSLQKHEATLAHQTSLTHSHPPSALNRTRMGLRALESHGWDPDARLGLGREGDGVRFPVKAVPKEDTLGIGAVEERREVKEKPRSLTAKEMKNLADNERRKAVRLQAEIYGRVDVEKYLRGNGGENDL